MGAIVVRQDGFERQAVIPSPVAGDFVPPPTVKERKAESRAKVDPWNAAKAKVDSVETFNSKEPVPNVGIASRWIGGNPSCDSFAFRRKSPLQSKAEIDRDATRSRDLNVIRRALQGVGHLEFSGGLWTLVSPSRTYSAKSLPELHRAVVS